MDFSGRHSKGRIESKCWIRLSQLLCLWILLIGLNGCVRQYSENTVLFDVKEGLAVDTLKEAARQAKVEFIFSSDLVKDLKTPAIKGRYVPSDAFKLMLAEYPLIVVQHPRSGVYSIQRQALAERQEHLLEH